MKHDPHIHHRKSIRLKGYDYSQAGSYFVTICTKAKAEFLGEVHNGEIILSPSGVIARLYWEALTTHFPDIILDEFVVMPNHVHGIVVIADDVHRERRGVQLNAPTPQFFSSSGGSLPVIVRTYKAAVTTWCRKNGYDEFAWQRNYYEHIIKGERDLNAIRKYIAENPANWFADEENRLSPDRAIVKR